MSVNTTTIYPKPDGSGGYFKKLTHTDGREEWFNEKHCRHRTDGPALTHPDGVSEWWIHGKYMVNYDHVRRAIKCSAEEIIILKLKWGSMKPWPPFG